MVCFLETRVSDEYSNVVVCNCEMSWFSDSCTGGDRRTRCTPAREIKVGFFLKSRFLFWRGEECREVACVHPHSESPENTLDVLLDLLILFPCQCCCPVGPGDSHVDFGVGTAPQY